MYEQLTHEYQEKILKKWQKVFDAGKPIEGKSARIATALVLENTQKEFMKPESERKPSILDNINCQVVEKLPEGAIARYDKKYKKENKD